MYVEKEKFLEKINKIGSKKPTRILYFDINHLKMFVAEKGHVYTENLFNEIKKIINDSIIATKISMDEFIVVKDFEDNFFDIIVAIIKKLEKEGLTATFVEMTRSNIDFKWNRIFKLLNMILYESKTQDVKYANIEFI